MHAADLEAVYTLLAPMLLVGGACWLLCWWCDKLDDVLKDDGRMW